MHHFTLTYSYPRNALHLSEEERGSFDVDNKDQVEQFIQEAIEAVSEKSEGEPSETMAAVIESMLEDGALEDEVRKDAFEVDPNRDGHHFRDFVMNYVRDNYVQALARHKKRCAALTTTNPSKNKRGTA